MRITLDYWILWLAIVGAAALLLPLAWKSKRAKIVASMLFGVGSSPLLVTALFIIFEPGRQDVPGWFWLLLVTLFAVALGCLGSHVYTAVPSPMNRTLGRS